MTDLKCNAVIVTGSNSGIGKAVAEKYYELGYYVVGLDIESDFSDYPILKCDVSDEEAVKKTFDELSKTVSSICYLVNCAGIYFSESRDTIDKISLDEWNALYKNNTTSVMLVTKYAYPMLKASEGDKAIINISSDQVKYPRPKDTPYAVSKSAVESLSKACASAFLADRIRVNVVEAASVKTDFIHKISESEASRAEIYERQDKKMPFGLILPEDIAEIVCFLGSPKAKRITGQIILADSGLYI